MQQWDGARETSSGKFGPREISDRRRNWPQLTGRHTVQKWHSIRDTVMKDRQSNRDGGRIRPEINLQEEPEKDGRSGRDN
jgi:hypothetical protein